MSDTIHLFHEGKIEQSSDPITMYTSPVSKFAAAFIEIIISLHSRSLKKSLDAGSLHRKYRDPPGNPSDF